MTNLSSTDARRTELLAKVIDAVRLAEELSLTRVAVRLEQARLLLVPPRD
jgi:hypothetical protein